MVFLAGVQEAVLIVSTVYSHGQCRGFPFSRLSPTVIVCSPVRMPTGLWDLISVVFDGQACSHQECRSSWFVVEV